MLQKDSDINDNYSHTTEFYFDILQYKIQWENEEYIRYIINTKNLCDKKSNFIMIKNLDPEIEKSQLIESLSDFGKVIFCIIQPQIEKIDGYENLSYAIACFSNFDDAETAIEFLTDKLINGIPIEIFHFIPETDETFESCIIKNLPDKFNDEDLFQLFEEFGTPISSHIFYDEKGKSKNSGYCLMRSHEEAVQAVEGLNLRKIDNYELFCIPSLSIDEIQNKLSKIKPKELNNYIDNMKNIQEKFLEFIENEKKDDSELIELLNQQDFDSHEFKSFLYLILKISNNHFRSPFFFKKIFQILKIYEDTIKKTFSNEDIFNFFKSNKRIVLFLIQEKILNIDENISEKMFNLNSNYSKYFYPEIKDFIKKDINESFKILEEDPSSFYCLREIGENSENICQMIRKDDVDGFISYVNRNDVDINNYLIDESIFETNSFLLKNQPNLIEYSSFFGSINIFKYLIKNNIKLTPSIWLYGIHGNNPEILHLLEEKQVDFFKEEKNDFFECNNDSNAYFCLKESLKCHHNDIANYFLENYIDYNQNQYAKNEIDYVLHYYNYNFFSYNFDNYNVFDFACKYDHYIIVQFLLIIQRFYKTLKMICICFFK